MATGDLATTLVLITDCQTTGPTPENGRLLEAAWAAARAVDDPGEPAVSSFLAAQPEGEEIPPRITRLTGITTEMMAGARTDEEIWRELRSAAGKKRCLAHFSGFEERFYRRLHDSAGAGGTFPLVFVCTHRIACRLLPDLPRRGLRTLAGYFGHAMPELKRAADHVRATHFIWARLSQLLADEGVTTLDRLDRFLEAPPPKRGKRFVTPLPREERLTLTESPGIYRFINGAEEVIYVGKATSLRERVNSYYRKRRKADKELEIVSQAARVETVPTGTSLEAALLEAEEIKRLDPPYNSALRDPGRAFGAAGEVAELARVTNYPLPRPCAVTDIGLTGTWFRLVGDLAAGRGNPEVTAAVWESLRLQHYKPCNPELFAEGTAFFFDVHGLERSGRLARALGVLSRGLWLEMRERQRRERETRAAGELEEAESGPVEEPEGDEDEEVELTPEILAGRLTGLTRTVGHQLRRGRWLAMLAGAGISWDQRDGDGRRRVSLPGEPPDTLERYDLLRVLTTELRRLVRDGRDPEVRLRQGRALYGDRLNRILELI